MKKSRSFRWPASLLLLAALFLSAPSALAWPDLAVTKTGPATASPGDTVTYTLVYTNKGLITASNVTLVDVLPAKLSPRTNTLGAATYNGTNITWNLGSLQVNKGGTLTFQALVGASLATGQTVTNLVRIQTTTAESITNNNTSKAVTTIVAPACTPLSLAPLTNQVVCEGGSAVYSTTVLSGSAPYTLQWYHNGVLLTAETNATLVLTNLAPADSGICLVVASNACSQLTNAAPLGVVAALSQVTGPFDQSVCPGATAVFTVAANGDGLTYQWYLNSTQLTNETASSLIVTNVSQANTGVYTVAVSGSCGSPITNQAVLSLTTPITLLTAPSNLTVLQGSNAVFAALASGTGLSFEWTFNGNVLGTGTNLLLSQVTTNDSGSYCLRITGPCGNSLTACASLNVIALESIDVGLADQSVCVGGTAAFTVSASGTGLTYAWLHETNLLSGETNNTLVLTNVAPADAGLYSVIVSDALEDPITNSASLTVNAPLSLVNPPGNQTNCPGSTAVFSATVTGDGIQYQWYANSALLLAQTNNSLLLTNVSAADAGTYQVVVSDTCGNIVTNSASLVLNTPVQATPLSDQAACPGGSALFSTTASGTGPFSYAWFRNGNLLGNQNSSFILLTNIGPGDVGTYTVVVNGACGSVSNSAALTLNTPITATPLANSTNCVGTTAVFSTTASGSGPLSYEWARNGVLLAGQNASSLVLSNLASTNAGTYSVTVSGACGSVTNSAYLVVNTPANVTPLTSTTNCAGTTALFSTTVTGSGSYAFQWYKDGNPLLGRTATSLVLSNVTEIDAGTYSIVVIGGCGSVTNSATLTVKPATSATPLSSLVRNPGQTAVFTTTASGSGPFTFVWKKNGTNISGQSGNSLVLSNLTYAAEGTYAVEVTGSCNTATQSATLHINLAPTVAITAPTNGASFLAPANITVAATANDSDGTVTNVIFYQGTNQVSQTTNGNPYLLMLTNVSVGTYIFKAVATDNGGLSATSAPVTVNVIVQPPLTIVTAMHLDLQTGLFEETVRVTNPTYSVFDAVRVYIYGINSPMRVYNASGVTNGVPYVQSSGGVQPGSHVDFTIEYYVPVAGATPNPTLVAALVPPATGGGPAVFGAGQHITRGILLANGNFLVEFVSLTNRIYYIEYGPDASTWKPAQPAVTGNGTSIQWIDNGEPKTDGAPADQSSRFYRVILLPP